MINLNDLKEEEKEIKIFNGGNAGRATNITVSVLKKAPEEKENAPDFKILYTDETGATINDGVYYPKDSDTDKQKQISLSRLVSVLNALNPETKSKMLPEFKEYKEAVDFLIKQIMVSAKAGKVNIFACYGTENNPQQYLRVRKFNFIENFKVGEDHTRLRPKINTDPANSGWNDVMTRITPSSFDNSSYAAEDAEDIFGSSEDAKNDGLEDW